MGQKEHWMRSKFRLGNTALLKASLAVLLFSTPSWAKSFSEISADTPAKSPLITVSDKELLKNSQISYRAEGGFSGIRSYSVILSCVNGRISVLKTIHDPRSSAKTIHNRGTLNAKAYLRLWNSLNRQKALSTANVAEPKMDISDEFTHVFDIRAGQHKNSFSVHGIQRPEACQQFAIKNLIDQTVQMQNFIETHQYLAKK